MSHDARGTERWLGSKNLRLSRGTTVMSVARIMRAIGSGMGVDVDVEADMGPLDSSACPRALPCAAVARTIEDKRLTN
jgi:hypothetical protein